MSGAEVTICHPKPGPLAVQVSYPASPVRFAVGR
jgi:hypothetical protein